MTFGKISKRWVAQREAAEAAARARAKVRVASPTPQQAPRAGWYWTLVRHSGYPKPGFERAVDSAAVQSQADLNRIARVGGLLFESYEAAAKREYIENYPAGVTGMYPRCEGTFSPTCVGSNRRIYLPKRKDGDA